MKPSVGTWILVAVVVALVERAPSARAQQAPRAPRKAPPVNHFQAAPPGPGAIRYEELAADAATAKPGQELKAGVDKVRAWATAQGTPEVHAAWSRYTATAAAEAQAKTAEYEAGLTGHAERGVR